MGITNAVMLNGKFKKCSLVLGLASAIAMGINSPVSADADKLQLDIKSQQVGYALTELGKNASVQIIFPKGSDSKAMTTAVQGEFTLASALSRMLADTGLVYEFVSDDSVVIKQASDSGKNQQKEKIREKRQQVMDEVIVTATKRETSLQDTALSISVLNSDIIDKRGLTKMDDYMSTVPGVTMQERGGTGNTIVMRGISVNHGDEAVGVYFGETPVSGGLGATWGSGTFDLKMVDIDRVEVLLGPQGTLFGSGSMGGAVRIIPAEPNLNETSGKVFAEYSQTGERGGGNNVLQGVFNLPLIEDKLAVRGVAYRFDDSGYVDNIAASYSGPWGSAISVNTRDTLGETAEAWGADVRDQDNRGAIKTTGARFSALWQPTEEFSVNLSYTWQQVEGNGWPDVDINLPGKFQQTRVGPSLKSNLLDGSDFVVNGNGPAIGPEGFYSELNTYALTLDYDLGWGSLHSVSAWLDREAWNHGDSTKDLPTLGVFFTFDERSTDRFFQEVRFASEFEGPFQILAGLYYEDIDNKLSFGEAFGGDPDQIPNFITTAIDNGYGVPAVTHDWPEMYMVAPHWDDTLQQKAVFGEVSWDIIETLTATFGIRHYEYDQSNYQTLAGFWYSSAEEFVWGDVAGDNKGETYKANLSWKPSDDTLLYFQWAEGFRPGKALPVLNLSVYDPEGTGFYTKMDGTNIPIRTQTDPDTLENFELGFKGTFADGRINFNAAAYHINWQGLPVDVRVVEVNNPGIGAGTTVNAGESTSEGVELEAHLLLSDNWSLDLGTSWNETKLAKDQAGLGQKGDDLPNSADLSYSAGLEYGFVVSGYDAFIRGDYSYVGKYNVYLNQNPILPQTGGYSQINLKGGVNVGNMAFSVYIRNLTNSDDFTWVSDGWQKGGPEAFRLRPRTIGMNISYQF